MPARRIKVGVGMLFCQIGAKIGYQLTIETSLDAFHSYCINDRSEFFFNRKPIRQMASIDGAVDKCSLNAWQDSSFHSEFQRAKLHNVGRPC